MLEAYRVIRSRASVAPQWWFTGRSRSAVKWARRSGAADQSAAQHSDSVRDDAIVEIEARIAGEEGDVRLPIAHLALQALALAERHVGRVRHDEVHRPRGDRGHQVTGHEAHGRSEAAGILAGD